MAFEIPSTRWTQMPAGPGPRSAAPAPLDWAGLRARLVAARELRRVVEQAAPAPLANGGSFARDIAARLAVADDPSPGVNPNDLGNRKAAAPMDQNDGGILVSADRGMQ